MWHLLPNEFEKFWLGVINLLSRDFRPYVIIGDSHCHIYCRMIESRSNIYVPIPLICYATSARGLVSKTSRSGAGVRIARMASALSQSRTSVPVIVKFGQVDVEFVFDFHRTKFGGVNFDEKEWVAYLGKSVDSYVQFVDEHFQKLKFRALGIFPPALVDDVLRNLRGLTPPVGVETICAILATEGSGRLLFGGA